MENYDVIIIGGGPGGSTVAWKLARYGLRPLVLDKDAFPRLKLCAGWITPEVVRDLEIDPATYPHRFVTFNGIKAQYFSSFGTHSLTFSDTQHSISRTEFDAWLLERSGAEVRKHTVRSIQKDGDEFVIDNAYRAKYLVGAGGTHCPVFRTLFADLNPRTKEYQIGALEQEFEYNYEDDTCRLWFGENGIVGYSWYVPKGKNLINVGIGGFSEYIGNGQITLREHWDLFTRRLADEGLVTGHTYKPKGHTYFVREPVKVGQFGNAFIVGDSAGLATRDLAEGIGPAVESALRCAESIAEKKPYSLEGLTEYSAFLKDSFGNSFMDRFLDRRGTFFRDWIYGTGWKRKEARGKKKLADLRSSETESSKEPAGVS